MTAVAELRPVPHRLEFIPGREISYIDDAYNANPEGAQVALGLVRGRRPGAPLEQADGGLGTAGARQARRADAAAGLRVAQLLLHQPVLERVVRHDRQTATGSERRHGAVEGVRELVQLAVHLDADRLEGALGGVAAAAAGRCGDRVAHDLRELLGVGDRPRRHDRPGDACGVPLLPVGADDAGELVRVVAVDDVVRGDRLTTVHPHVERSSRPVREAALGDVQLR